jgi:hypothetical protein
VCFQSGEALDPRAHRDERVDHRVPDVVDVGLRAALGQEVLPRFRRVDEEQLGEVVGDDPVDLFGQRAVERAQPGLDVPDRQRDAVTRGHRQFTSPGTGDVRLGLEEHGSRLHHARGLLRVQEPTRASSQDRRRRVSRKISDSSRS